jgi:signal transduction histidine kinase
MKLSYKVALSTFGVLLAIGLIGAMMMLNLQRQAAESQFEQSGMVLAEAVHDSLANDMIRANRDHIQDAVLRIASRSPINEVVVINTDRKIVASGEPEELGEIREDEDIARALTSGLTVTRYEEQYGHSEMCVIVPIMNQPECHTCHGPEPKILGAIEIGLARAPLEDQIKEQTLVMMLIGGITFVVLGTVLAFVIRSEVGTPLAGLAASAQKIAEGDFSARAKVTSKDEVGVLARTFNEMAGHVEQYSRAIEDSKQELEQKIRERTQQVQDMAAIRGRLLDRLISAQEEERRRIARELHDEAGQALTMIMMNLARTIDTLPKDATAAKERLSQSRSLAEGTLGELRKLIYELRPELLDQLGMVPALRSYVKTRLEAANIKVQLQFLGLQERLPSQVEITLFRVIQEAVTNIVRHSGASMVAIQVTASDSAVTATVEDDGRGFDAEAVLKAPESWGLRGIRERVAVIGGELSIESAPRQGTCLRVHIPLEYLIHAQTANSARG